MGSKRPKKLNLAKCLSINKHKRKWKGRSDLGWWHKESERTRKTGKEWQTNKEWWSDRVTEGVCVWEKESHSKERWQRMDKGTWRAAAVAQKSHFVPLPSKFTMEWKTDTSLDECVYILWGYGCAMQVFLTVACWCLLAKQRRSRSSSFSFLALIQAKLSTMFSFSPLFPSGSTWLFWSTINVLFVCITHVLGS